MSEESFLLVSLEEGKAKKLAEVISNESCRKILDYLGKNHKGVSESDVAKELKLPLSTVHYNLQNLVKANLVKADEYHYSQKGKEILHYSLTNKLIIIAPTASRSNKVMDALKKFLPIVLVFGILSFLIELMNRNFIAKNASLAATTLMDSGAVADQARIMSEVAPNVADTAEIGAMKIADGLSMIAQNISSNITNASSSIADNLSNAASFAQDIAMNNAGVSNTAVQTANNIPWYQTSISLWFLLGGLLVLFVLFILELAKKN